MFVKFSCRSRNFAYFRMSANLAWINNFLQYFLFWNRNWLPSFVLFYIPFHNSIQNGIILAKHATRFFSLEISKLFINIFFSLSFFIVFLMEFAFIFTEMNIISFVLSFNRYHFIDHFILCALLNIHNPKILIIEWATECYRVAKHRITSNE